MGRIITGLSKDGSVVCHVIDSTDIVARAEQTHQTSAVVTAALGRLLTAASLMGSQMKFEKESITLRVKGDGPVGALIAVSDHQGNVRGYPENPIVELPLSGKGKLDVSAAVGKNGSLSVIRDFGSGEPYIGNIKLVSGEIAEDITAYYAYSEQTPTVCALGVLVNTDLTVLHGGGFLAQLMPGAPEEAIAQLEKNIAGIPAVTTMLAEGRTLEDILDLILDGLEPNIIAEKQVEYRCDCSRERVENTLISLGKDELTALMEEDGKVEVNCHFCPHKYRFNKAELATMITKVGSHRENNDKDAIYTKHQPD